MQERRAISLPPSSGACWTSPLAFNIQPFPVVQLVTTTMSEVPVTLSSLPVESVLGALLLGVSINAFFYGFSVLQFAQYRTRLFRDSWATQ